MAISPNTVISPERKAAYPQPESGMTRHSIRQREINGTEFGRAGKVLRNSIRQLLQNIDDSKMVGRLTKEMVKISPNEHHQSEI